MSRLQKKCLIASSALHGLLAVILLVGTAFLVKEEEHVDQTVLNFIPDKLVDAAMQRAAGPLAPATPPPSQPPAPISQPPPVTPTAAKQTEPEANPNPPKEKEQPPEPKEEPKRPKLEPKKIEAEEKKKDPKKVDDTELRASKTPKKSEPAKPPRTPVTVNLKATTLRSNADIEAARRETAAAAAKANAARVATALSKFEATTSKLTSDNIGVSAFGDGTIGVSYASFESWVQKVYWEAWRPPTDLAAGRSVVKVKVVIRKDGTIESANVTEPSGNSRLDANIRQLLARVKTVHQGFPEGAKEEKRSYNIEFNLEAKLGSG